MEQVRQISLKTLVPVGMIATIIIAVFGGGLWVQSVNSYIVELKSDITEIQDTYGDLMENLSDNKQRITIVETNYGMILTSLSEIKADLKTLKNEKARYN